MKKSEKQGAVGRNNYALTAASCTACLLTECNLQCEQGGETSVWSQFEPGKGGGNVLSLSI